eukprot:TRINITY_DN14762_c1_g1_i1.p1 TRINITY_DN14762_c1_g1~~TRINITY_DN14762_c1_g1_i1.p1  ORF type:complete len:176 (-),score=32.12 TRINITY_DN14762_c1_g1_i1:67-594(-)
MFLLKAAMRGFHASLFRAATGPRSLAIFGSALSFSTAALPFASSSQKPWPSICDTDPPMKGMFKDGGRVRIILEEVGYLKSGGRAKPNENEADRRRRFELVRSAAATTICWTINELLSHKVRKACIDESDRENAIARHVAVKAAATAVQQSTDEKSVEELERAVEALLELYDLES